MVNRAAFSPPPGIVLGETDYSIPGQWCAGSNVRFVNGKAQPIGGWDLLNASPLITDSCVAMLEWISKAGTRYLALGNTGNASVLSGSTLATATDIKPIGFSSSSNNRWTFDLWGDHLIACWSGNKIYEWDLNLANDLVAVTNAPTTVTVAGVTHTRQLMAFGCNEETSGTFNPRCIRWSDTEDNTDWTTSPANLAGEYILDGSGGSIRAARKFGTNWAVWTDDELFLGHYTSDPANPWVFERQAIGCGTAGPDGVTIADGVAYWISTDLRFMMWVPGSPPAEIPGLPVYYLNSASYIASATSFVWHNRRFNEIWFHPRGSSSFPTTYLAVNATSLRTDRPIWMTGTLGRSCMYQGISACYGFDSASTTKLFQHETSKTGYNGGVGLTDFLTWSIEALVYLDKGQRRVQIQRLLPDVEAQAGNITFTLSALDYPQGAETTLQTKTLAVGDDKSDFRAGGKLFRFKFSGSDASAVSDTFGRLGLMTFEMVIEGER